MKAIVRSTTKRIRVVGNRDLVDFNLGPDLVIELTPHARLRYFSAIGFRQREKRVYFRLARGARLEAETIVVGQGRVRLAIDHVVEHRGRDTTAYNRVVGVFDGAVSAAVQGLIYVPPTGQGSVSRLEQRALLLSPAPAVRMLPQLKIEADDVDVHHASAASPLDEIQIFYCQSRGMSSAAAVRLLVAAFFQESLRHITDAAMRQRFTQQLERALLLS